MFKRPGDFKGVAAPKKQTELYPYKLSEQKSNLINIHIYSSFQLKC